MKSMNDLLSSMQSLLNRLFSFSWNFDTSESSASALTSLVATEPETRTALIALMCDNGAGALADPSTFREHAKKWYKTVDRFSGDRQLPADLLEFANVLLESAEPSPADLWARLVSYLHVTGHGLNRGLHQQERRAEAVKVVLDRFTGQTRDTSVETASVIIRALACVTEPVKGNLVPSLWDTSEDFEWGEQFERRDPAQMDAVSRITAALLVYPDWDTIPALVYLVGKEQVEGALNHLIVSEGILEWLDPLPVGELSAHDFNSMMVSAKGESPFNWDDQDEHGKARGHVFQQTDGSFSVWEQNDSVITYALDAIRNTADGELVVEVVSARDAHEAGPSLELGEQDDIQILDVLAASTGLVCFNWENLDEDGRAPGSIFEQVDGSFSDRMNSGSVYAYTLTARRLSEEAATIVVTGVEDVRPIILDGSGDRTPAVMPAPTVLGGSN